MQRDLPETFPMQATKEQHVLLLNLRKKLAGPKPVRRADRHADKFGADPPQSPVIFLYRQTGTAPDTGFRFMDAYRAYNPIRHSRHAAGGDDGNGDFIDNIAIIARENTLLFTKHFST
ncbi:hypothetical protein ANI02nite_03230 [Acetobacter nitrogenifigens DSM 23921 = NBRC 105050]|uniref:Uncharacterized protein n=1 Tax=Acetobacter nitrogenifigens DSM 23921 = NBRC 105050 TaxID=1120919 RepID=A0A511X674_9PROT|nr:hypothetical protein ANI02nite_03230 [Acetobacter nitrogenifigens DSM 23921 = NBRC 105050]